uniref:Protein kinase domain-containing protein n=1 Tax=Haemonchus contortus TaxID=6289 RepID=A0A7I5ECD2_HAECO|nr:unnamed protein product [Haemonchus contortus]
MNWHFLTLTTVILTYFYRDDLLRYLHQIEDILLPIDSLDLSIFNDLEQKANGFVIRGTDPSYLNCSNGEPSVNKTLASGWSKVVELLSENTVIKRPNFEGRTYRDCFHANFGRNDWEIRCNLEMLKSFASEIKALLKLRNASTVIMIMSYCIPSNPLSNIERLNIVTERGTPLDVLHLVQLSPHQRHKIVDIIEEFFISYPTLRLHDFRRQQIVLVDGQPKIVDFDGAYFSDENLDGDQYLSAILRKLQSEMLLNPSSAQKSAQIMDSNKRI